MMTLRATYKDGQVHFIDNIPAGECDNVLVTFLDDLESPVVTGEDFVNKWAGILKGAKVGDRKEIREERLRALARKHQ